MIIARAVFGYFCTNSASIVMVTSSPTSTPPASRALFQPRLKSLRLILVEADTPRTVMPNGDLAGALSAVALSVTGLVTPLMVRSPSILRPSPSLLTDLDLKVSLGNLATSKKSGDLRWSSRLVSRVSMEAASISTVIEDLVTSLSSTVSVPLAVLKRPLVLDTIMWRTEKPISEWEASSSQVDAKAAVGAASKVVVSARASE